EYPEYRENAKLVKLVETTSAGYYGAGYQDVQNRVPKIDNTMQDLGWKPTFTMDQALHKILDAYKDKISEAASLNS
ncbi:MAG: bifunctional UDP-4-keto-pentose/UDP-xylose synthase, partial [Burkholderiaceae bacterium]